MFLLFSAIIFVLGILSPVQTAANARTDSIIHSPLTATLCNFIVGSLLMFAIAACTGSLSGFQGLPFGELPWWAWCGGLAGVVGITANVLLFPVLGSVQTVLVPMVGQVAMGILIDSFGLFEAGRIPLTGLRLAGFIIVLVGAFLVVSSKRSGKEGRSLIGWQVVGFVAGAFLASQPAINSKLAEGIGSPVEASLISFVEGTVILVLFILCLGRHRRSMPLMFKKRPLWTWSGGFIGVGCVLGFTFLASAVGIGLLTVLNIFGMLVCSVLLDNFGWLGATKSKVTLKQCIGLVCVLAGIIAINL